MPYWEVPVEVLEDRTELAIWAMKSLEVTINSKSKKKKKNTASRIFQKSSLKANPGCLLAKIGKKEYAVGGEAVFRVEASGILFFGPFEWGDYSDNIGSLKVTFQVSDK